MTTINIIGYFAAILSTVGFLPQAIKVLKSRQTRDISLMMYLIITIALLTWSVYGFLTQQWHIVIANSISFCFTLPVLILKLMSKQ